MSFGRPPALSGAWLGVLATGLIAAVALQATLAAVAFLVAWPLVLASLGAAATRLGARDDLIASAALAVLAALGGGWLAVFFHGVAQGLDLPALLGLFLWLGALLLWPLAWPAKTARRVRTPALTVLALGLVLLGVVRVKDPWTARHPQATTVFHVTDDVTGKTWLAAATPDLDAWSRAALTAGGGEVSRQDIAPLGRGPVWAAAAPPVAAGTARVLVDQLPDGRTRVTLPQARVALVEVRADRPLTTLEINGQTVTLQAKPGDWIHVRLAGIAAPGHLILAGPTVEVRYSLVTEGWPATAKPLPPRPGDVMAFDLSDSAVRTGTVKAAF
ncbi:MAG: hypothetical protein Q8L66_12725 [Caulobacter sp.]|nr:hypothetical protein [Caulobacter sp.]